MIYTDSGVRNGNRDRDESTELDNDQADDAEPLVTNSRESRKAEESSHARGMVRIAKDALGHAAEGHIGGEISPRGPALARIVRLPFGRRRISAPGENPMMKPEMIAAISMPVPV